MGDVVSDQYRSPEVDAFLAALPEAQRDALQRLRDDIHALVPAATEAISYGVPTLILHGPLLALGATKTQCSLYVMRPKLVAALRASLAPHQASGGTIHFAPEDPLPPAILERIVRERVFENEAAAVRRSERRRK
ncbi:MAG: DUF1801 domain-containing protein [Dehalococcoidia bacterium]